jgi:hypothetical protein
MHASILRASTRRASTLRVPACTAALLAALAAGCATTSAMTGTASVSGDIGNGVDTPPALRVCAMPIGAGGGRCIDVPAGATSYRIDALADGRYYLMGWVSPAGTSGDVRLYAHASTIRCVRAPCPADSLVAVEVASGAALTDIDLNGVYGEVPAGWPGEPAR